MKKLSLLVLLVAIIAVPALDAAAQGGRGRGGANNNRGNQQSGWFAFASSLTAEDEQKLLSNFDEDTKESLAVLKTTDAREYYRTLRQADMTAKGLCVNPQGAPAAGYGRGYNRANCPLVN